MIEKSNILGSRLDDDKVPENSDRINIIITGDFCPHKRIEQFFLKEEYKSVFNGFEKIANNCDLVITDLECPLTFSNIPIAKTGPNLKAHPDCINGIKFGGFNIVALANNHIMDFGKQGLADTINACDKNNIRYVGAGQNINEASKPLYLTIKKTKIAIVNFCENEWSIATENKAGANPLNPVKNYYQIKEAKDKSDFVLVIVHGGHEQYKYPSPRMVNTYRFFADCGANAVIGHHTHCPSGYEKYNNVPIFYSLGNFIFDWEKILSRSWHESYFIKLIINNNAVIDFSLIPYKQCDKEPRIELLGNKQKQIFLNKINGYSKVIRNSDLLEKKWLEFCDSRKKYYFSLLLSLGKLRKQLLKNKKLSRFVLKRKRLLILLNFIRCQAHRDIIITIIEKK